VCQREKVWSDCVSAGESVERLCCEREKVSSDCVSAGESVKRPCASGAQESARGVRRRTKEAAAQRSILEQLEKGDKIGQPQGPNLGGATFPFPYPCTAGFTINPKLNPNSPKPYA
jgi:hypothetical protein